MQSFQLKLSTLVLSVCLGFTSTALWAQSTNKATDTNSQNQSKTTQNNNVPMEDIARFTAAIEQIKQYYVTPVSDDVLFENAIRGMLAGLDPHSTYLDIADYAELQASTQGEFGGLGVEVDMEQGVVQVVSPVDGTPAAKAGLKPGDLIIKINNQSLEGMSLTDAVTLMRGPKGSAIELTVIRKNVNHPLKFKIVRDIIRTQSVKSALLTPGYGYVRITQFQEPTAADLEKAVQKLEQENKAPLKGFVLDLRNNPGGLLNSAITVSDDFLNSNKLGKNTLIVYTKGRTADSEFKAKSDPLDIIHGIPMVVLINGGSASAAEIVAGALQDHKRAIIMGTPSFGKGSVQTVLPLDEKHGIKITTALYYTPNGRSIQAKGITPDIQVNEMDMSNMKREDNEDDMLGIKESNLANHLNNGNANTATPDNSDNPDSNNTAPANENTVNAIGNLNQDYQLNQALSLLKGLNTLGGTAYRQ